MSLLNNENVVAVAASSTEADKIIAENGDKYVFLNDIFPVSETETQMVVLGQKGEKELITEINKIIEGQLKKWGDSGNKEMAKLLKETVEKLISEIGK